MYVGKTQNTALQRYQTHISASKSKYKKTIPLYKYINKIGIDNVGVIPFVGSNTKIYKYRINYV